MHSRVTGASAPSVNSFGSTRQRVGPQRAAPDSVQPNHLEKQEMYMTHASGSEHLLLAIESRQKDRTWQNRPRASKPEG